MSNKSVLDKVGDGIQAVFDYAAEHHRTLLMAATAGVLGYNQWRYVTKGDGLFMRLDETFTPQQLMVGTSVLNVLLVSYLLIGACVSGSEAGSTARRRGHMAFSLLAVGLVGAAVGIVLLGRVINHASRSVRDQTPYGRALAMFKTAVYGALAVYAIYKAVTWSGVFRGAPNAVLGAVASFFGWLQQDMAELYKISAPVRTLVLAVFVAAAVYAVFPLARRFLNRAETRVLAKYLDLRREHVISSFSTLHPNFEDTLKRGMMAAARAARGARDHLRGTLDDAMGQVRERASGEGEGVDEIVERPDGMRYDYAVRFKLFLHEPGSYTARDEPRRLFSYGDKPLFQYNSAAQQLTVGVRGADGELREIYRTRDVRYQRWTEYTVNFVDGRVDVLEDGRVIATSADVVPYSSRDNIVVGEEGGVEGGIANVVYSLHPYAAGKV